MHELKSWLVVILLCSNYGRARREGPGHLSSLGKSSWERMGQRQAARVASARQMFFLVSVARAYFPDERPTGNRLHRKRGGAPNATQLDCFGGQPPDHLVAPQRAPFPRQGAGAAKGGGPSKTAMPIAGGGGGRQGLFSCAVIQHRRIHAEN